MSKKFFIISLALVMLSFSVSAFAGEGSDTIGACKLLPELRYAYYETPVVFTAAPLDSLRYLDNWEVREHNATLQVNYGVTDYLDVYAFVGARIAAVKDGEYEFIPQRGVINNRLEFDLGSSFLSGVGVKATFFRAPNGFYVGGGASFSYTFTGDKINQKTYHDGEFIGDSASSGVYFKETEMAATADIHAGWHIGNTGLTPYIGAEYRWVREDLDAYKYGARIPLGDYTTEAEEAFGAFVGVDYMVNNRLYLNLEGQMIKRWGGSFSVGYLFDLCATPPPPPPPAPVAPPIEPKLEPMSYK